MSLYDKASENYALALHAFQEKMYNAAASRLYYAFYQACVKKHVENGRTPADFMSPQERTARREGLRSNTDAPKWPHDVLTRYASLKDLGLNIEQRQTVLHAKQWRIIGDYGDKDTVDPERIKLLTGRAADVFRKLRAPIAGR